jgi:hypothetical protein
LVASPHSRFSPASEKGRFSENGATDKFLPAAAAQVTGKVAGEAVAHSGLGNRPGGIVSEDRDSRRHNPSPEYSCRGALIT